MLLNSRQQCYRRNSNAAGIIQFGRKRIRSGGMAFCPLCGGTGRVHGGNLSGGGFRVGHALAVFESPLLPDGPDST